MSDQSHAQCQPAHVCMHAHELHAAVCNAPACLSVSDAVASHNMTAPGISHCHTHVHHQASINGNNPIIKLHFVALQCWPIVMTGRAVSSSQPATYGYHQLLQPAVR